MKTSAWADDPVASAARASSDLVVTARPRLFPVHQSQKQPNPVRAFPEPPAWSIPHGHALDLDDIALYRYSICPQGRGRHDVAHLDTLRAVQQAGVFIVMSASLELGFFPGQKGPGTRC